ncbi:DsbA family protein [Roseovarius sp. LXJ103]|uniref:DsbA family protein n=1 Tax=Roseovarius carneus TaxID=2853164 RepID=UPI000D620F31|nr:DsbA family protein [Roseovarius carneus]MBZ8119215.1 DsbA family protein [Roseovarius carneus]PWE35159.1 disulfide bond formation protein DsbA [Pelagicola sp. LXJ1103]
MTLKRTLPAALAACLAVSPVAALDLADMSEAERAAFGDAVRSYLLENPAVVFEAVDVFNAQQEELQSANDGDLIAANAEAIFNDGVSWAGGNPDGDVTIVEFLDYACGFCKKAHPEVAELVEGDGNIRLVFKELPVLGEPSVLAARFAISTLQVAGEDAYKAVHDAMMTFGGRLNEAAFTRIAEALELDPAPILAGMDAPKVDAVLVANSELAATLGLRGTPGFVMQDRMVRGYVPLEGMLEIVADIREN